MKTAFVLLVISALLMVPAAYSSEYLKIQARTDSSGSTVLSELIYLEPGDVCEVLTFYADNLTSSIVFGAETAPGTYDPTSWTMADTGVDNLVFIGPGRVNVQARNDTNSLVWASVKVTRASEGDGYLPTNTVVIPTQPSGNIEIILESSTDLLNWVSATPGTYVTTSEKRFFRVRAERVE
jgi:hypothetical protein